MIEDVRVQCTDFYKDDTKKREQLHYKTRTTLLKGKTKLVNGSREKINSYHKKQYPKLNKTKKTVPYLEKLQI